MAYKNIKNTIINTSCNLFSDKGYLNVSVNEICSACSITKPTFYYHFKSKEDILFAEFNNVLDNCISSLNSIKKDNNGRTILLNCFECIFSEFVMLGYDFIQNLIIGTLKDIEHAFYFPKDLKDFIMSAIKKGMKDGSIKDSCEPEILYLTCCHAFLGYVTFWCQHNGLVGDDCSMTDIMSALTK